MDETNVSLKDSAKSSETTTPLSQKDKANLSEKDGHSTTTRTYTQAEHEKEISDAFSKEGMKRKAVEKLLSEERKTKETLVSQLASKDMEIESIQSKISNLENEIDEMSRDDPDRQRYVKKYRELLILDEKLKVERGQIDTEKGAWAEDLKVVKEVKRNTLMGEVAGEYEDGDTERLKEICDSLEIPDNADKIRLIAETLWKKIDTNDKEETKEPPYADSGINKGGSGESFTRSQIKDRAFWEKHREEIIKADKRGKIK
uniref:Scaffolding protein n=1 Tax=viral metagenome TaxID=1070528 RepID=A0A6M3J4Z0_9ZZZZ